MYPYPERDFILFVEQEVKNFKLNKINDIEKNLRDYRELIGLLNADKYTSLTKDFTHLSFFIVLLLLSVAFLVTMFFPHVILDYLKVDDIPKYAIRLFSLVALVLSSIALYLYIDKIQTRNRLYKLNKIFDRFGSLIENISHEEKVKYELLMDYLASRTRVHH